MLFDQRFKLTWDQSVDQFREELPWQMIAFLIFLGSVLTGWLIMILGNRAISSSHRRKSGIKKCGRSAGGLFIISVALLVLFAGIWIACQTAGVSVFNILFGYGIAAGLMGWMFNSGLAAIGVYMEIRYSGIVVEGDYLEFDGPGNVEGLVDEINIFNTILRFKAPNGTMIRERSIPTAYLLQTGFSTSEEKAKELIRLEEMSVSMVVPPTVQAPMPSGVRLRTKPIQ